jgi:hypothetical protein
MFWLLIVTIWAKAEARPYPLKPVVNETQALCEKVGQKFIENASGNLPEGVSGVSWGCLQVSNPNTEKTL